MADMTSENKRLSKLVTSMTKIVTHLCYQGWIQGSKFAMDASWQTKGWLNLSDSNIKEWHSPITDVNNEYIAHSAQNAFLNPVEQCRGLGMTLSTCCLKLSKLQHFLGVINSLSFYIIMLLHKSMMVVVGKKEITVWLYWQLNRNVDFYQESMVSDGLGPRVNENIDNTAYL
jgi:hypothetical protein